MIEVTNYLTSFFFSVERMEFIMAHIFTIFMTLMIYCHAVPIRNEITSTISAVWEEYRDQYSPTKDSAGDDRLFVVKSISKRTAECEKHITRVLENTFTTVDGGSNLMERICRSCDKEQDFDFVDVCYKIDNKSILKNINNNKCKNGIEVKMPVRVGCKGGC